MSVCDFDGGPHTLCKVPNHANRPPHCCLCDEDLEPTDQGHTDGSTK